MEIGSHGNMGLWELHNFEIWKYGSFKNMEMRTHWTLEVLRIGHLEIWK